MCTCVCFTRAGFVGLTSGSLMFFAYRCSSTSGHMLRSYSCCAGIERNRSAHLPKYKYQYLHICLHIHSYKEACEVRPCLHVGRQADRLTDIQQVRHASTTAHCMCKRRYVNTHNHLCMQTLGEVCAGEWMCFRPHLVHMCAHTHRPLLSKESAVRGRLQTCVPQDTRPPEFRGKGIRYAKDSGRLFGPKPQVLHEFGPG